jgi:sugar/nucleoside kinase (ribokinase family)
MRASPQLDWRDAIRFANCAAAISTTGLGAPIGLATADQVAE